MRRLFLIAILIPGLPTMRSGGSIVAGESGLELYTSSPTFVVSVAPVDKASENAESSMLYQQNPDGETWRAIGSCRKATAPGGTVRFLREVAVEGDGRYRFTSRPIVGGQVMDPPDAFSLPQATVVVDTLAPVVRLSAPPEGEAIIPGSDMRIAWKSGDENLPPLPAAFSFSTDGGKSWIPVADSLPAEGEMNWAAPADLTGPALLRLAAADKAGNVGRDSSRLELARAVAPEADKPETPAAVDKPIPAGSEELEPRASARGDRGRSWLYYLMALNLMRQDKPADALQYYWLAVREDPEFIDAWADIGLAYIAVGAYKTARETAERARDLAPDRPDLMHLMGETCQAEGMELLSRADSPEKRMEAKGLIDQAAAWYGLALEKAEADWRLAEQAASFFRLGEICYFVNLDRDGARAYWEKILKLHVPAPNPDLALWTPEDRRDRAITRLQHDTARRVSLDTWQNWARGYLKQLDARERVGMVDFPSAGEAAAGKPLSLPCGQNFLNPGRADGRSLFSPPDWSGSPPRIPSASGISGPVRNPLERYRFYARKGAGGEGNRNGAPVRPGRRGSRFTGGPELPPPLEPDPYAFPTRDRGTAAWFGTGRYGDLPGEDR
ncbi:MAG: tetratricopeptide repeat protein [Planctomycetota bacterium]|jgi:tetratricopeptide (TPR) repeat protein|nr:tetratricopeptide repeat protein [Planctomycetota bacterium]